MSGAQRAKTFYADYPSTLGQEVAGGQHYMMIESYESTNAVQFDATKKLSSIGLYIPAGSLTTSFTGNYEGSSGASQKALLMQKGTDTLDAAKKAIDTGTGMKGFIDSMKAAGTPAGNSVGSSVSAKAQQAFAKLDAFGFIQAGGNSPNNYMAMVYGGPNQFREHTFVFKFFPKNHKETEVVHAIIEEFKRGTLPRMSRIGPTDGNQLTDPFFKSPRQHTIKFMKGGTGGRNGSENPYLFKIGTSVITNMVLNYDPQSMVGFHADGSPVGIDLNLTFKEIQFQISEDNVSGQNLNLSGAVLQNQALASRAQGLADLADRGQVEAGQGFSSPTRDF